MRCYPIMHKQTIDKIVRLAYETETKYGVMAELLFSCGYRIGDVRKLRKRSITNGNILTLDFIESKTGIRRVFQQHELPESLVSYVKKLQMEDFLFPSNQRNKNGDICPVSYHQIRRVFKEIFAKVGIQGTYGTHVFRKTFASRIYQKEQDVLKVMKALGHKSVNSTISYLPGVINL